MIYFIQDIFFNDHVLTDENSFNPLIAQQIKNNIEEFQKRMAELIKENQINRYDNKNNTSMKFTKNKEQHNLILKKILEQDKDIDLVDRVEEFKSWFVNNFSEQIIKKGN